MGIHPGYLSSAQHSIQLHICSTAVWSGILGGVLFPMRPPERPNRPLRLQRLLLLACTHEACVVLVRMKKSKNRELYMWHLQGLQCLQVCLTARLLDCPPPIRSSPQSSMALSTVGDLTVALLFSSCSITAPQHVEADSRWGDIKSGLCLAVPCIRRFCV